jgi:transposase
MSHKTAATVAHTIGIDTGKNTLHLIGLDDKGAIVLREKISRGRITARLANVPRCLIGIEAGMATHYVARELSALSHDEKQVPPAFAKPFRRSRERLQRRPRDRGGCSAAVDTLRSSEDRRSA